LYAAVILLGIGQVQVPHRVLQGRPLGRETGFRRVIHRWRLQVRLQP